MAKANPDTLSGFFPDGQKFFKQLKRHNNKDWFEANKALYQATVQNPSRLFADRLAQELKSLCDQPLQPKIFRINRDMRFARDKSPYKTHVHMSFSGSLVGGKPHGAAFFFGLEAERIIFGAGCFVLEKSMLDAYRRAVIDEVTGAGLAKILNRLERTGTLPGEPELKRVPPGIDSSHPREALLRRKSLAVWRRYDAPDQLSSADPLKACRAEFKPLLPLYNWLSENTLTT